MAILRIQGASARGPSEMNRPKYRPRGIGLSVIILVMLPSEAETVMKDIEGILSLVDRRQQFAVSLDALQGER